MELLTHKVTKQKISGKDRLMADPGNPDLPQWLKDGWAFILAIIGWVWHAGRLASKVDILDKKLEDHMDDEDSWRQEEAKRNQREHERIIDRLEKLTDNYYVKNNRQ